MSFTHALRVRYAECDPQGIVFNANYMMYVDVAFTEFWREAVGPWQEMVERGVDMVVAEANLRFLSPARFDDELALRVKPARLGESSLTTELEIMRREELLVDVQIRHVCVSTETWSKTSIPRWVREGLGAVRIRRRIAAPPARRRRHLPCASAGVTRALSPMIWSGFGQLGEELSDARKKLPGTDTLRRAGSPRDHRTARRRELQSLLQTLPAATAEGMQRRAERR